jgi:imidazolonepropionase-like amidohydrolase
VDAASILGVADRVGSLQPGRDADVAVFDGDPFEYTSHCTAVVIDGRIVADEPR